VGQDAVLSANRLLPAFSIDVQSAFKGEGVVEMSLANQEVTMLQINNLHAQLAPDKPILRGINLQINPGEIHAIMGPNGSGKSTLANVLAGRDQYTVTQGEVSFDGKNLLSLAPEERAVAGIFLAFQYPVEIPGVNNAYFLRTALNSIRKNRGESELDAFDFMQLLKTTLKKVGLDDKFVQRAVNEGFSGGEKKRNEIAQMLILQPRLAILDETDSGLDIDALQMIAEGVNSLRSPQRAIVVVTHYQRLLDYIIPDYVHVLTKGRIVRTGDKTLAQELEQKGYGWLEQWTQEAA
jgi:Fe-S cluster assembly ATP-binding protein